MAAKVERPKGKKLTKKEEQLIKEDQPRGVQVLVNMLENLRPKSGYGCVNQYPYLIESQRKCAQLENEIEEFKNTDPKLRGMYNEKHELEKDMELFKARVNSDVNKLVAKLNTKGSTPELRDQVLAMVEKYSNAGD